MDMGPARNIPGGHPKSGITCYRLLSEIFRQPGYLIRNLNAAESHRSKKREQMGGADNPVNTRGTRRLCYVDCCRFDSWSITLDFGISHLVNSASVYYLLRPPRDVTIRTAAGIAIIVVYFVLLTPLALSYFRSLQVVLTNPGYVPKASPGRPSTTSSSANDRTRHDGPSTANNRDTRTRYQKDASSRNGYIDRGAVFGGRSSPPTGLEHFYSRDIYECEIDGLPRWCSSCNSWKPDRSHHCREVDRCVYKMDHYCPWLALPSSLRLVSSGRLRSSWTTRIRSYVFNLDIQGRHKV